MEIAFSWKLYLRHGSDIFQSSQLYYYSFKWHLKLRLLIGQAVIIQGKFGLKERRNLTFLAQRLEFCQ